MKSLIVAILLFFISFNAYTQISLNRFEGLKIGVGIYPITGMFSIKTPPARRIGLEIMGKTNVWVLSSTQNQVAYTIETRVLHRIAILRHSTFFQALGFNYTKTNNSIWYGATLPVGLEIFPFSEIKGLAVVLEAGVYYTTTGDIAKNIGTQTSVGINYFFYRE